MGQANEEKKRKGGEERIREKRKGSRTEDNRVRFNIIPTNGVTRQNNVLQ